MNANNGADPRLFLDTLQAAAAVEMAHVNHVSMDLFMADRDRWMNLGIRHQNLTKQLAQLVEAKADDATTSPIKAKLQALAVEQDQRTSMGLLVSNSDNMLYGGKRAGETLAVLARTLAHLAHNPGGVTAFGLHWCAGSGHVGMTKTSPGPCDAEYARLAKAEAA